MGDVGAKIKVMPKGVETNLEELKQRIEASIPGGVKLHDISEEPIAFGLKALMVQVIMGDEEGGTDPIEDALSQIEGVESVQVVGVGLI